ARLVQVPFPPAGADVRQELVGDLGDRDKRDVQLLSRDQAEQQVERAFEDVEVHMEALAGVLHAGDVDVRCRMGCHACDGSPAAARARADAPQRRTNRTQAQTSRSNGSAMMSTSGSSGGRWPASGSNSPTRMTATPHASSSR